jgi:hypothetical protein
MTTAAVFTPIKGHECVIEYHAAMMQLARWPGMQFDWSQSPEDLVRTRSRGVRWFLDGRQDQLIMWDSDIAPNPRHIIRMLEIPHEFIASRYRLKKEPVIYVPPVDPLAKPDSWGCIPVDFVPLGLVKVSRNVLQKMWDHYKEELGFLDVYQGKTHDTVALFQLILTKVEEGSLSALMGAPVGKTVLLSEDYSFSKRARDIGIPIHLMIEPVPHVGGYVFK